MKAEGKEGGKECGEGSVAGPGKAWRLAHFGPGARRSLPRAAFLAQVPFAPPHPVQNTPAQSGPPIHHLRRGRQSLSCLTDRTEELRRGQSPPRWRRNRKQQQQRPPPPPFPAKSRPASPPPLSYPDSGLGEVGPDRDLLPRRHVRVAVPLESGFQFLQLLAGEVSALPPLPLLLGRIFGARVLILARLAFLFLCGRQSRVRSGEEEEKARQGEGGKAEGKKESHRSLGRLYRPATGSPGEANLWERAACDPSLLHCRKSRGVDVEEPQSGWYDLKRGPGGSAD